jgi:hypothetical protein
MKTLTTLFFLLLVQLLAAQTASTVPNNRFSLKLTPLALLDIYGGNSFRIGTEFKLKNNIAASLEYGTYFSYSAKGFFEPLKIGTRGNILRAEVKYYRNNDKLCTGGFFSLEYLYKNISFDYIDSISIAPKPTYEKRYTIYKEISCLTFKVGELNVYKNHFVVEWYAGLGLRFYTCGHNTLTEEERNGLLTGEFHGGLIGDAQRVNAFKILPNLSLGIKVGYLFR